MKMFFILHLKWTGVNDMILLAGEACLLSRLAESSWTWACHEANDWFRGCCQFWGGDCYSNMWLLVATSHNGFYYDVVDTINCIVLIVWLPITQIDGDLATTIKFIDSLKIPYIAASFGGCESIVDQPAILSYWYLFGFLVLCLIFDNYSSWAMVVLEYDPIMKSSLVGPLCCSVSNLHCFVYLLTWSFVVCIFSLHYSATGIFLSQKGLSIRFTTTWFASALELKILRIWRLMSCKLWKPYRPYSFIHASFFLPFFNRVLCSFFVTSGEWIELWSPNVLFGLYCWNSNLCLTFNPAFPTNINKKWFSYGSFHDSLFSVKTDVFGLYFFFTLGSNSVLKCIFCFNFVLGVANSTFILK